MANNKIEMLAPLVLGYVVGAVGVYTMLSRSAPVLEEDPSYRMLERETGESGQSEVIHLFAEEQVRKAA